MLLIFTMKQAASARFDRSPFRRVGQACDLKGDHKEAKSAYNEVLRLLPQSETAKEARNYLLFPYKRKKLVASLNTTSHHVPSL